MQILTLRKENEIYLFTNVFIFWFFNLYILYGHGNCGKGLNIVYVPMTTFIFKVWKEGDIEIFLDSNVEKNCLSFEQVYNGLLNLEFRSFFGFYTLLSWFRNKIKFLMFDICGIDV